MADFDLCGNGDIEFVEDPKAADRWAITKMTEALKQNPDLARELWVVLKLAGSEVQ